ncbi:MAG: hypothetical protein ACOY82_05565 [Pseudomonadota bacterium]
MSAGSDTAAASFSPRAAGLAVAAGGIATVAGLIAHGTWRALPAERFALSLVLAMLALAAAWPLRRWLRWSQATALAAVWLVALSVYAGPLPVLAVGLLGAAALAIGLRLTPDGLPARSAIAGIVGLLLVAGLCGWIVRLPVHRLWLWLPLLFAIVAFERRTLRRSALELRDGWREAVASAPRAAAATVLLFGLASTACWLPSLQMDDLTYHLGLPSQWRSRGVYAPEPSVQIWSYAPWAGDILHGIAGVLARRDAHGALNALWLALAAGASWSLLAALRATARERWSALALFGAFPPLVWMAAGQQTELAATATTLAFTATIVSDAPRRLWAGTLLFAGLFALKPAHGLAALPLLLYAGWRHRDALPWARLPAAVVLFAVVALSSHVQAWSATGNPVFPLFNDVFASPLMPAVRFDDPRWHAGFAPDLLWRIAFDSDRYVEGWDGGLGFGLIALGGLWLLQLLRSRHRLLFLAATIALLLPLIPLQYARYAWPGIVLLCALLPLGAEVALGRRAFAACIVALCALNLAYQANASWLHHSAALKRTIRSPFDDTALLRAYLPERLLLRRLPADDRGILLATDPARGFVAELGARGRAVSPHSPTLQAAFAEVERDARGGGLSRFAVRWHLRWALLNTETASPALRAAFAHAQGARLVAREGALELWELDPIAPDRTPAP